MKTEEKDLGGGWKQVTEFFDSGKIYCKYQELNGKKQGEDVWYYENGELWLKCNWNNGKIHGEEVWFYDNGQIEIKQNWVDGDLHGEEVWSIRMDKSKENATGIMVTFTAKELGSMKMGK